MKKLTLLVIAFIAMIGMNAQTLIISEVVDGTGAGGYPKYVEVTNIGSVAIDLSNFKIRKSSNGGAFGDAFTFPAFSLPAGESYVVTNIDGTTSGQKWSDFNLTEPTNETLDVGGINGNGNDAYALTDLSNNIIDIYGREEDGTGQDWEYLDSYAYRNSDVTAPSATFNASEWTIPGPNVLDGHGDDLSPYLTPGTHNFSASSPIIVKAISLTADTLGVAYSSGLSSVDANNYTLLDGTTPITFGFASPINLDQDTVVLSSPSRTIIADVVLDTLVDAGVTDSAVFYAGIMPIEYTNSASATIVQNNYYFTIKALVTANDNHNNVWIKDIDGAFGGVMIYSYSFVSEVAVGDTIILAAQIGEHNGLTELINPELLNIINSGNTVPVVTIDGADIDTSYHSELPAEKWEGQIVEIDSVTITETGNYYFYGQTPDGSVIKIGDNVDYHFNNISMNVGTTYNIIGVVDYYGGFYRLNPRSQDDITELATSGSNTLNLAIGLTENEVAASYDANLDTINASFYVLRQGNGVDVTFTDFLLPDPEDSTVVILYGADNAIANDNQVDTLFDLYNNTSFEFYAGILPLSMTNNTSSEQVDDSHYATYAGVVTANDNFNQVWIQDAAGATNGQLIYVNSNSDDSLLVTDIGDSIYVCAVKTSYNGMTELTDALIIPLIDSANIPNHQVYAAQVDPSHLDYNLTQDAAIAEVWEGQLVKLNGIVIDSLDANYQYYGHTCDGAIVAFNDDVDYHYGSGFTMDIGSMYNVTGVVTFSYGHYLVNPRMVDDAETVTFIGSEVQEPANQTPGDSIMISEHSDVTTAFEVAKFVVADQGGDGLPTIISDLTILAGDNNTVNFEDELDGGIVMFTDFNLIEFSDDPVLTANSIQLFFEQDSMLIPDGESREFVAYVWLNIDNAVSEHVLEFKINSDNFNVFDPTCTSSPFTNSGTDITSNQFVLYEPAAVDELANSVAVYPNPATSVVNISGDVASIELFNSLGQEINVELKDNSIDISNLQAGVYFARIILANGEVVNTQIIKK